MKPSFCVPSPSPPQKGGWWQLSHLHGHSAHPRFLKGPLTRWAPVQAQRWASFKKWKAAGMMEQREPRAEGTSGAPCLSRSDACPPHGPTPLCEAFLASSKRKQHCPRQHVMEVEVRMGCPRKRGFQDNQNPHYVLTLCHELIYRP